MKKTLLSLVLVTSSMMAYELSKECKYVKKLSSGKLYTLSTNNKSEIEKHMDCVFEYKAKKETHLYSGRFAGWYTYDVFTYDKKTKTFTSNQILKNNSIKGLKKHANSREKGLCTDTYFAPYIPYGLKVNTVYTYNGKEVFRDRASQENCNLKANIAKVKTEKKEPLFIDIVKNKEYVSKQYAGLTSLIFNSDTLATLDGNQLKIKLTKDNQLNVYVSDKISEKSNILNDKNHVFLLDIKEKLGQKVKQKTLYIRKDLVLNLKQCSDLEITTQEAYSYLYKKNGGKIYCNTINRDTKQYYTDKLSLKELNIVGLWKDKKSGNLFEFFEDGTWSLNNKKQSLYSKYKDDFMKLEYFDKLNYSIYGKPYFGEDYKKTNCLKLPSYKIRYSKETDTLELCKM